MDQNSLEDLAKWADGRALGVTLSAMNAFAATGIIREFMEARRTRAGRFAIDPNCDAKQWFEFYRAPTQTERAIVRATCGEEAEWLLPLLDALRKPKDADQQTQAAVVALILGCFVRPTGSQVFEVLQHAANALQDDEEACPDDPALLFAFWVELPCWFNYGCRSWKLLRQISNGGDQAEIAIRRLVRLDNSITSHKAIQRWVRAVPGLMPFRAAKLEKWKRQRPFDKDKAGSLSLRRISGLLAKLSYLFDDQMDVRDQRALIEALGGSIPADSQAYVTNSTNDDFSRAIRRESGHFDMPPKPDRSKYELVRGILEGLQ